MKRLKNLFLVSVPRTEFHIAEMCVNGVITAIIMRLFRLTPRGKRQR